MLPQWLLQKSHKYATSKSPIDYTLHHIKSGTSLATYSISMTFKVLIKKMSIWTSIYRDSQLSMPLELYIYLSVLCPD